MDLLNPEEILYNEISNVNNLRKKNKIKLKIRKRLHKKS
jgi:hypothetical protein